MVTSAVNVLVHAGSAPRLVMGPEAIIEAVR